MLDRDFLRKNVEFVQQKLRERGYDLNLTPFLALDDERRTLKQEIDNLRRLRKERSKEYGRLKSQGKEDKSLREEARKIGDEIQEKENRLREIEKQIHEFLLTIPNIPHPSVPVGEDENDNVEIRKWGKIKEFDFEPLPHWELGTRLGMFDFPRAAKITGARFAMSYSDLAKIERALISLMLDLHTKKGYMEVLPPFISNEASLIGTGNLPKFKEELFKIEGKDWYLIPTAEVPLTNIYRDEILQEAELPKKFVAYTPCFRAEAGAAGKDTKGLIRLHQFNKVELMIFSRPEDSYQMLEVLTSDAEDVLKTLELPYRVVALCTGDLGFSSAKTYDIEVWMPSYGKYVEISSCSNFEAFQARRANIRYKGPGFKKPEFVHTLNGSGLAIGRTVAAIMENFQNKDGSITIPEAIRPYMGGQSLIKSVKI
ncbi:MAG: serine--tRNA ligase [Candidatus Aminicenantes bacterium]|nr:serine--tRNA ligase [Candidatus Aminicenantes bacterium]